MTPAAFLTDLHARGIELLVTGRRLRSRNWPSLTAEEQRFVRSHRQELKRLLQDGAVGVASRETSAAVSPEGAPVSTAPEVPEDIRRITDWNTPAQIERRHREATAVMMRQVGKPSPWF